MPAPKDILTAMKTIYRETVSLCPICAKDSPAYYEERADEVYLRVECDWCGIYIEKVESDMRFFAEGYEQEYERLVKHLIVPVTYRCNLACKFCYTFSNSSFRRPCDRPVEWITGIAGDFGGNCTLIGGEPTVREDLPDIIRATKHAIGKKRISIGTNGQRLGDIEYLKGLKGNGLDFVFLSLNDIEYEESESVYRNKIEALRNCLKLNIPVWFQRTIDDLKQLDSVPEILDSFKKAIYNVTLRAVKPFGPYWPVKQIFVSDIVKYLGKESSATKGTMPFNRYVVLKGKTTKVCSWVNDVKMTDPVDSNYVISDGTLTTFHRGMKMDEKIIMGSGSFLPQSNAIR